MKSILLALSVLFQTQSKNQLSMNAIQKASPVLLIGLLIVGGLQFLGVINLFGDNANPPVEEAAAEYFNGAYFTQVAALQSGQRGNKELSKALAAVRNGSRSVELSARAIEDLAATLNAVEQATIDGLVVRRLKCPPICPPSPCQPEDPNFIINCLPATFLQEDLTRFALPRINGERFIELKNAKGKTIAKTDKGKNLEDQAVLYKLDVPKKFSNGQLVITEQDGRRKSVTTLDLDILR
jgi:hypothetical protein